MDEAFEEPRELKPVLETGKSYVLDRDDNNRSTVRLVRAGAVYATVENDAGKRWDVMASRLSEIPAPAWLQMLHGENPEPERALPVMVDDGKRIAVIGAGAPALLGKIAERFSGYASGPLVFSSVTDAEDYAKKYPGALDSPWLINAEQKPLPVLKEMDHDTGPKEPKRRRPFNNRSAGMSDQKRKAARKAQKVARRGNRRGKR